MKHFTLLAAASLPLLLQAQTEITINTQASNSQQVWYRLSDDTETVAPISNWDLGFEINGFAASILVNTAKGDVVYNTDLGVAGWETLTELDIDNWTELHNSETSWSGGALTSGTDGNFNLGWGTYQMSNHVVVGTELFVVKIGGTDTYLKLRIDGLASSIYSFTYANLDGSDEQSHTLAKSAFSGKNFGYWDLTTHASVDREPAANAWDLLFTKYYSDLGVMWYSVAGVLQNKTVRAAQLDGIDQATVSHHAAVDVFSSDINIIGSDWKAYDFNAGGYLYEDERAYFVQSVDGAIWKLLFIGYGGGATGTMTFTKELVSATNVEEVALNGTAAVYPNPVSGGVVSVLLDLPVANALLEVYDLTGKQVMSTNVTGLSPMTARTIDISTLTTGAYVARFVHDKGVATAKLIVE